MWRGCLPSQDRPQRTYGYSHGFLTAFLVYVLLSVMLPTPIRSVSPNQRSHHASCLDQIYKIYPHLPNQLNFPDRPLSLPAEWKKANCVQRPRLVLRLCYSLAMGSLMGVVIKILCASVFFSTKQNNDFNEHKCLLWKLREIIHDMLDKCPGPWWVLHKH